MANWDVIVLGLGGVGSAAAYHLARSHCRVLGIDRYPPAHDRGSSHGKTRIIRQAYFEHPSYVPLLRRSYSLWHELQQRSGGQLYFRTGLVEIGPADGIVIGGVKRSAQQHCLQIEELTMSEVTGKWPGLVGRENWQAVLEKDAGFLRVEDCVDAHLRLAVDAGAVCRHECVVRRWCERGSGVQIETDSGIETADHLVIAAGAWSGSLLHSLGVELTVLRKHQYWFAADRPGYEMSDHFPCFFYETPSGYYYGFPSLQGSGIKVSRHSGGKRIHQPGGPHPLDPQDRRWVDHFVRECLPELSGPVLSQIGCYYTMTPDEHFIVDKIGNHDQVTVIAGLSGHGFKFTSVLGEIACQLARGDRPQLDLSLFRIARFSGS